MRFFLRKNGEKIRFFIAFPAIFRDFCKIEKNSQVQNFWRILKGAPCNLQADHRQIMGRSWAVSRIFSKLCPNCTKSLYNHQRRSGAQKQRWTFAYMATPYCDFTHFQYSFSAEGACENRNIFTRFHIFTSFSLKNISKS